MHMLLGSTLVLTSERQINRQRICNLGVFTLTDVMLLDMNQRKKSISLFIRKQINLFEL